MQADRNSTFTRAAEAEARPERCRPANLAIRDGNDIIIQQIITNYGEKPIDYTAFVICPGQATAGAAGDGPGRGPDDLKKYRFKDVKVTNQMRVRSGLKESEGTRILNDEVGVE